jgi:hypothetical protein
VIRGSDLPLPVADAMVSAVEPANTNAERAAEDGRSASRAAEGAHEARSHLGPVNREDRHNGDKRDRWGRDGATVPGTPVDALGQPGLAAGRGRHEARSGELQALGGLPPR